jgi:hypothetical protein
VSSEQTGKIDSRTAIDGPFVAHSKARERVAQKDDFDSSEASTLSAHRALKSLTRLRSNLCALDGRASRYKEVSESQQ